MDEHLEVGRGRVYNRSINSNGTMKGVDEVCACVCACDEGCVYVMNDEGVHLKAWP